MNRTLIGQAVVTAPDSFIHTNDYIMHYSEPFSSQWPLYRRYWKHKIRSVHHC